MIEVSFYVKVLFNECNEVTSIIFFNEMHNSEFNGRYDKYFGNADIEVCVCVMCVKFFRNIFHSQIGR